MVTNQGSPLIDELLNADRPTLEERLAALPEPVREAVIQIILNRLQRPLTAAEYRRQMGAVTPAPRPGS